MAPCVVANGARKGEAAKLVKPKMKRGERDVYMPPELARELKRHRLPRRHTTEVDFVFGSASGKPLTQRHADRAIRKAGTRAGLSPEGVKPVSAHDLRHSVVTRWIDDGVVLVRVSAMAGRSKVSTTTDEYAHVIKHAADAKREPRRGPSSTLQASAASSGVRRKH